MSPKHLKKYNEITSYSECFSSLTLWLTKNDPRNLSVQQQVCSLRQSYHSCPPNTNMIPSRLRNSLQFPPQTTDTCSSPRSTRLRTGSSACATEDRGQQCEKRCKPGFFTLVQTPIASFANSRQNRPLSEAVLCAGWQTSDQDMAIS